MRLVGFYREFQIVDNGAYAGNIHDVVRPNPSVDEAEVLSYLNGGARVVEFMEAARDVISGDNYVTAGSSLVTDGLWVWRLDLAHYVARYHLELDREFLLRVAEHDGVCPEVSMEALRSVTDDIKVTFFGG